MVSMALTVIAPAYGGPEVLALVDEPVAEPGPGQARIEVRAAGVNPVDYKSYSGRMGADPARLPAAPGLRGRRGDHRRRRGRRRPGRAARCRAMRSSRFRAPGAYAAELLVPADALVPKPLRAGLGPGQRADADRRHGLARAGRHRRAPGRHRADPRRVWRRRHHGGPAGRRAGRPGHRHRLPGPARVPARAGRHARGLWRRAGRPGPGGGAPGRRRGAGPGRHRRGHRRLAGAGRRPGPRSPPSWPPGARSTWASRCWAARRAPIRAPRSAARPGWTWCGWSARAGCACS